MNQTPEEFVDSLPDPEYSALDMLNKWSANGESGNMKQKMLNNVFILKDIAILGEWTVFYARHNTGKTLLTLWLLREAILDKRINPSDVYYANCDDTMKGGQEKLEHIAEKHGFNMLIPGVNNFRAEHLLGVMTALVDEELANGKIIILDTLKKFTNLMDKTESSSFGIRAREFISAGGSLICLAHTNKHKNEEGKSVHAGTSDIANDCDCTFIIENLGKTDNGDGSTTTTIKFCTDKARGYVDDELTFKFSRSPNHEYMDVLNSVERVTHEESEAAKKAKIIAEGHDRDRDIIDAVFEAIHCESLGKTELIETVYSQTFISRPKIGQCLNRWEGRDYSRGHLWFTRKHDKNKRVYHRTVKNTPGG